MLRRLTHRVGQISSSSQFARRRFSQSTCRNLIRARAATSCSVYSSSSFSPCVVQARHASTGLGDSNDVEVLSSTDGTSTLLEAASAVAADPSLASIGLGGWMPPGWVQQFLDLLHSHFGLSWCAAIVGTTVAVRVLTLPIYIHSRRVSIRLANHWPMLARYEQRIMAAQRYSKYAEQQQITNERDEYKKKHNVSPFHFCFPLVQAPFFLTMLYGVRGLAEAHLPSMAEGGAFWFTDLTAADPYGILPLLTAGTLLITLETGAEGVSTSSMNRNVRIMMRVVCVGSVWAMWYFPAALNLYWLVSNLISLGLVNALKTDPLRRLFNLPAVVHHDAQTLQTLAEQTAEQRLSVGEIVSQVRDRRAEAERQAMLDEFARRAAEAQRTQNKQTASQVFSDPEADEAYNDAIRRGQSSAKRTDRAVASSSLKKSSPQ